MLYRALAEPYLRYCNTTWGNCGATSLNRLQTLQNRAARVITGISYEDADHKRLSKDLNILNVRQLVEPDTASLMYRVENDSVPAHIKNMFTNCSEIHAYNTRAANAGNYVIIKIRTEKGKQAFQQTVPKVWNKLPDFIRSQSIESFQETTKKFISDRD